jgi:hypothetical protein
MKSICLFLILTFSAGAAQLTEGILGDPLPATPSKLTKGMLEINRDGDVTLIPRSQRPPNSVSLHVVSEEMAAAIWRSIGGSLSSVKSPADAKAKESPFYPFGMRRRGERGSAICLFEVTAKGQVGRIFRVGGGSDQFFKECVRALQSWRFAEQNIVTYRVIEFTAKSQNPPNQQPEPTPPGGTSAAEQTSVPASVVSHL